ncbi:PREDICTED: atrial natriuretic peptide receptor 1-like [Priapulus caudatus]|uniref:guanylate cyclase n=1 Tax=Priapulus caudatus TaxID=37621 RepID=A0ABM1EQR7_PRICU|nr:PREDICTED: atrial natriuretic peptide receptor 1-like [Priapulus caudatus]
MEVRMKDVIHDNLEQIHGAVVDPPTLCLDIIENDDIMLDNNFKYSFLMDLVSGMEYLHKSHLQSHGNLKERLFVTHTRRPTVSSIIAGCSTIADYGLPSFLGWNRSKERAMIERTTEFLDHQTKGGQHHKAASNITEYQANRLYAGKQWTAPEILRENFPPPRGTQRGDVYSFAIIMYELIFRCPPYNFDVITPRDAISRIRNGEAKPFRPTLTDMTVVADSLKLGKPVPPEQYDSVSIYFSDIVGFTTIASDSSPLQIVDFLNDLYSVFDDIISQHDVYKVETIGDAYMVVSGLPQRNGKVHLREIANCSLDLLSSVTNFKIRHRPQQQLRLRIGLHTGSCVAGVVGLTMPRYCLFGSSVNHTVLMESSGKPLRIHISQEFYNGLRQFDQGGYEVKKRGEMNVKGPFFPYSQ